MSPAKRESPAAKAARLAAKRTAESEGPDTPGRHVQASTDEIRRPSAGLRSKPVRVTLDLAPEMHADLARWCGDSARDLGLGSVKTVEVLRALIRRLLADGELAEDIRARIVRDR